MISKIREISIGEFQLRFKEVLKAISCGYTYRITKYGIPIAEAKSEVDIKISDITQWISSRKARMSLGELVIKARHENELIMITSSGQPRALLRAIRY